MHHVNVTGERAEHNLHTTTEAILNDSNNIKDVINEDISSNSSPLRGKNKFNHLSQME